MKFSDALNIMQAGADICREGWNGSNLFIRIIIDVRCDNKAWIGLFQNNQLITPWTASQTDMLANDWLQLPNKR